MADKPSLGKKADIDLPRTGARGPLRSCSEPVQGIWGVGAGRLAPWQRRRREAIAETHGVSFHALASDDQRCICGLRHNLHRHCRYLSWFGRGKFACAVDASTVRAVLAVIEKER